MERLRKRKFNTIGLVREVSGKTLTVINIPRSVF